MNAKGNGWAGQLYPYAKADGIYHCPEDKLRGDYISYAENANLVRRPQKVLDDPSATVELYEMSTPNCDPSGANGKDTVSATGLSAPTNSTRHDANTYALNFLAADGHVRFLMPDKIANGTNAVSPTKIGKGPYVLTFGVK